MEIYSIYSNYSIPSKRQKKKGLVGSIAQDYTVRGELSANLGCERKCTSFFYFFIILSLVSSVAAAI